MAVLKPSAGADAAERAARLRRFRGSVDDIDRKRYARWRDASADEHGRVLASLLSCASAMPRRPLEPLRFPGFHPRPDAVAPGR